MAEVSEKQLRANQQNAKLGGVKTEAGKQKSKFNALKHGILSNKVLLDDEDPEELELLKKRVFADLRPNPGVESLLADRVVSNFWRLGRVMDIEKKDVISSMGGLMYGAEKVFRYETMLENSIFKALRELRDRRETKDS